MYEPLPGDEVNHSSTLRGRGFTKLNLKEDDSISEAAEDADYFTNQANATDPDGFATLLNSKTFMGSRRSTKRGSLQR